MLTKRLIACFDVIDGRVTKAQQFQDNIDVAPAEELAARLYADQIDEIVFYDITASAERRRIAWSFRGRSDQPCTRREKFCLILQPIKKILLLQRPHLQQGLASHDLCLTEFGLP